MIDYTRLSLNILFLSIFLLNIWTLLIPAEGGEFLNSENFGAQLLRGFGFHVQSRENHSIIPRLTNDSMTIIQTFDTNDFKAYLKKSDYFVPGWADTRWNYRKNITIDYNQVDSDLTDFPVLIDLYDPDLQNEAQASGNDILFTDSLGSILDHEIEQYRRIYNSTHAHLVAWVKANLSSTQDTIISMYYGNPTVSSQENPEGVWKNNYIGVWHLSENPTEIFADSTYHNNDGTSNGSMTQSDQVNSMIDGGIEFDGSDDVIKVGDSSSLDSITNSITLSAWVNYYGYALGHRYAKIINKPLSSVDDPWNVFSLALDDTMGDNADFRFEISTGLAGSQEAVESVTDVAVNGWTYVVGTYDGSTMRIYVNATDEAQSSTSITLGTTNEDLQVGNWDLATDNRWYGILDDIRVSKSARSADWITTEYNNQHDPRSFYSISSKETYETSNWALNAFRYRKNMTINPTKVFQDLTDYPFLIDLFDTDLHDKEKVQVDGDDIVFTDASGAQLDHEIELFDQTGNGTHAHLVAWVRVPFVSNTVDTSILMYYGNPTVLNQQNPEEVWNSNYLAVHHLEESPISPLYDSTGNNEDLYSQGSMSSGDLVDTQIGQGIDFDDVNDALISSSTITVNSFTISAMINPDSVSDDWDCIVNVGNMDGDVRWVGLTNGLFTIDDAGSTYTFGAALSPDTWSHVVVTFDGSTVRGYINGSFEDSYSESWGQFTDKFQIGAFAYDDSYNLADFFDGMIDEVRIINTPRSAGWIASVHENQLHANTFYTIDKEETNLNWWVDSSFNSRRDIIINQSYANPFILNPMGSGSYSSISSENPTSGIHWQLVSDDDDSTYVEETTTNIRRDTYQTEDAPRNLGTITSVTVNVRVTSSTTTMAAAEIELVTHSQLYQGTAFWYEDYWLERSRTFTNNPYTNQAWTWDEVNGMEIGVELKGETGSTSRCSKVWAEVHYTLQETSLSNFPVLIDISDQSFRSGQVQSDAADFMFVDSYGTRLAHEVELFTQDTTHGNLTAWAKVPSLSLVNNTIISMYYGNNALLDQENPETVWDNNYRGIWHLNDNPIGTIHDSTSNNFDGSSGGSMSQTDLISAKISEGINFDGSNDYIAFPDPLTTETMTISSWVYLDAASADWITIAMRCDGMSWFDWQLYARASDAELTNEAVYRTLYPSTSEVGSNFALSTNTWYYVVGQHNGTHNLFFIDGTLSEVDEDSNTVKDNNEDMWIGGNEEWGEYLQGILDEVRVSSIARSEVWVAIEYENQDNPQSFYLLGPQLSLISDVHLEETVTAGGESVSELTSPEVTGVAGNLYLASVSTKPYMDTTSVTGLSLDWNELDDQPGGRSQTGISVWYAIGNTSSVGNVTATLSASVTSMVMQIHSFSGVAWYNPIGIFESANTNGENGAGTGGTDDPYPSLDIITTSYSSTIFGAIGRRHLIVSTPGQGYTLLTENQIGSSGDIAGISTEYKTDQKVGTVVVNATLSSNCDWAIIGVELKAAVIDILAPVIHDFGVDDPGTGNGIFWANITDNINVASAKLEINGTEYEMTDNGTHWVYSSPITFKNTYLYQITYATDETGNSLTLISNEESYMFTKDSVLPDVLDWTYIQANNTFQANVTDSWGEIDTVTVNVTTHNLNATMVCYKTFGSDTLAYMNDTVNMPNGPIDFQIVVNDTSGNEFISSTHSGTVYDNHPPVASDLTLSRDDVQVSLPVFSNCTLYLDYTYSDPDSHGEDGTEIRWYKNSGTGFELQPARNDTDFIPAAELVKGDQWYATVRPKDGEVFGEINQTATITIQNTPPQVSSVVVSPSNPVTTQALSVSNTTTDTDGDSITIYQIRWYNPSYNVSYDNQAIISSTETTKGETWWCELRAFDGTNYSSWVTSNSVTIENSAPSASNLAILPSSPGTGDMLTADYDFTDADNDPETGSTIRWYKNDILQGALNDSFMVNAGNTTKGDTWYFKITPSDGTDSGLEKTSDPVTILNTAPTASSLYISPASPVTTTSLTANYTWTDSDPSDSESGSEIIWYRTNILLGALNNSVTVDPSYTTKGEEWHFKVRPSDGADYGTWTSCPTNLTIGNTAPEATNLALTPTDAKTGNDLTATYTWVDNDTLDSETDSIIYWYLNRTGSFMIQSAYTNLSILSSTATQKGDMWKFGIIPSDGDDYGVQLNSSAITIGNTAPIVLNITINGFNETTMLQLDDNLTVGYIYYDADNVDNSSVDTEAAVEIRWYNQSQLVTGLNDVLFVFTGNTSSGEIWYCIIRVSDGSTFSNPTWSPSVSIAVPPNTPPEALDVLITPNDPKTGGWLNVTYVYYDEEGDPETFTTFRWYCNGIHQGQYDGIQNLSSAILIKGNTWYAEVQPRDDSDFGDWNASASVVIGNTAPEATNLMILPEMALTGSDLSVNYDWTDADDADSDANSIIYWYLNRTGSYVLQSAYTNQTTVLSTATLKGDLWIYELIPSDGTDVGIATNSTPLLIGNTAPSVSNLQITPLTPITGDDLKADYNWLDQDIIDSEIGSQIRWYKNGVLQPAYNDSLTINAGDTAKGENWFYTITPSDGAKFGSAKTSPLLTIGNTAPAVNNVEFTPGVPIANIDLSVNYDWSDVDLGDSESGTLIRWYRNDLLQATYNDLLTIDGILIVKGDNWTVSIKASDGTSLSPTWVNTSILVGNTPPTVTTVTISPSSPQTMDALEVSYGASDIDSMDTIVAYSIEWLLGGTPQPQFSNFTIIPAVNTSKGENWQARVKATDGEDWSAHVDSLGLTIANTKPSVANVTITGGTITSENISLTYDFVDVDNDPSFDTKITWRYVGYGSGTYNDLLEIPASYTKAGQQWWVEIIPQDIDEAIGETFNSWDYGMIIIVGNSPPTLNASDIAISGLLNETEYGGESYDSTHSLVLHYNATDIDGEQGAAVYGLNLVNGYALGSEYRWYRNRSGVTTLVSALNDQVTVSAQYTQKGDIWWVQVRVRDYFGAFGIPKNSSQILISNTVPSILNVHWSKAIYYTANSLSFSYTFFDYDTGDEEQGLLTRWYRNGTYLPEFDNNVTISAINTTKGDRWYVNVSVFDGEAYSIWYPLTNISILNSAPIALNVYLVPMAPNTTQALYASWAFVDADGDAEELDAAQIFWYRNGLLMPSLANNQTVPASLTNREEVWYYTVRVTDGMNYSVLHQSNTIRVINSAPSPSAIQINLGASYINTLDDLTVTWGFSDPDPLDIEDMTSTFIIWYLNGQQQVSLINSSVVPAAYTLKGQQWVVSIAVRDNGGLWSSFLNSSIITINNTPPQITMFAWNDLEYYTTSNLSFSYLFVDADNDTEVGILIHWYRNGVFLSEYTNNVSILAYNTTKGDRWYVNISVFDGEAYSFWYPLTNISILNSAPTALNVYLVPMAPNTTQPLEVSWAFQDLDDDTENQSAALIQWYQNGNLIPDLVNQRNVSNDRTRGGDSWYFTVSVFDGSDYSPSYQSNTILILNSAPSVSIIQLNTGEPIYAIDMMKVTWKFSDPDPQDIENHSGTLILWYLNGILQPQYTNKSSVGSEDLLKGQVWIVTIAVRDSGGLWSTPLNSSSVEITNSAPDITLHITAHPEFIVEDTALHIQSTYYTYFDADGDGNDPQIWWYRNNIYQPAHDDSVEISAAHTAPGDTWYYIFCPFDGTDLGNNCTSPNIWIETRPMIEDHDVEAQKTMDGLYHFWVTASDTRNNITEVRYEISLNGSTSPLTYTLNSANATGHWVLPFQLEDFAYLNTTASVTVTVTTTTGTGYSQEYSISNTSAFSTSLLDVAPPRIIKAYFTPNEEPNPSALDFYCELEEYGSGVDQVILYYSFELYEEPSSDNAGSGASVEQTYSQILMKKHNETDKSIYYGISVPFTANGTNWKVIYQIHASDNSGNHRTFDILLADPESVERDYIPFTPPSVNPTLVIIIVGVTLLLAFFGSIVYVKFIRKPELVGLDKDLVLGKIPEISDAEVMSSLDAHTIGIVVSFFDQRHGPIPIIIVPEILKDNFSKLVELSDRSFSGTGFSDDFSAEIPSSYDFVVAHGLRTSIMSFGYALERPQARGGQENLTLNIIIHQDLFPLVQSFQKAIQRQVHSLHVHMDKKPDEKNTIRKQVLNLRKYVSSIILSYERIYRTTELIEEED